MPAAATHTDLSRMKPVGFLKNPSELLEKEKKLMLEIWDASGMNDDEFSQTVVPAVQNLAQNALPSVDWINLLIEENASHQSKRRSGMRCSCGKRQGKSSHSMQVLFKKVLKSFV